MAKVSVIIPVYNKKKYLKQCMDSVINQTFTDFECILVDDGSTDGSDVEIDNYADTYPFVVPVHKKNGGLASARNAGLDKAAGEKIIFLDSDDYIADDFIESLYSEKYDLVCGGISMCREGSEKVYEKLCSSDSGREVAVDYDSVISLLNEKWLWSSCAKCYSKEIIDRYSMRFDESLLMYEDTPFVVDYTTKVKKVKIVSNDGYYYIQYGKGTSITKSYSPKLLEYGLKFNTKIRETLLAVYGKGADDPVIEKRFLRVYEDAIGSCAGSGNLSGDEKTKIISDILNCSEYKALKKKYKVSDGQPAYYRFLLGTGKPRLIASMGSLSNRMRKNNT